MVRVNLPLLFEYMIRRGYSYNTDDGFLRSPSGRELVVSNDGWIWYLDGGQQPCNCEKKVVSTSVGSAGFDYVREIVLEAFK